jgi:hypothetical protein
VSAQTILRPSLGPIEPHILYPLEELKARTGMKATALRTARRTGLKILYAGGRGYCMGRSFIDWLEANAKDHK